MTACSFTTCAVTATSEIRMIPRRTDAPISDEIKLAIVWPGVESATSVSACKLHREAFRLAARTVMAEVALGDDVAVRVVKD